MNHPYRPPIAAPDGSVSPVPPVVSVRGDWSTAPKVVRSWAYQLTWLGMVILPFFVLAAFWRAPVGVSNSDEAFSQRIGQAMFYIMLLATDIWLNRALKKGEGSAWTVQIVLSVLGLLAFPIGTAIHAYILSQWFKPATRAWFGK